MTGNQIKAMRLALGMSQVALAEAVGVSDVTLWMWEKRGEADAAPSRLSKKWDALVAFLSTAAPAHPLRTFAPRGYPLTSAAGLLYPWLETAGPEYRARIRAAIGGRA